MADLDFVQVNDSDPAAEFLAREQENLAGLEDEFENQLNVAEMKAASLVDEDSPQIFEQSDEPDHLNGDHVNGHNGYNSGYDSAPVDNKPEPEKIRVWREEQSRLLEQKDAEEEEKREELRQHAKKELEEWYTRYAEQLEKSKLNNRNAEKDWIAERDVEQPGQEWEKIAKMCDFNPKAARNTKDTSRMRSILLQLKQSPPVANSVNTSS